MNSIYKKIGASMYVVLLALVSLFFFEPPRADAQGAECHLLTSQQTVPQGFGASYNALSLTKELLVKATCSTAGVTVTVGTGAPTQYIYKQGYEWKNNAWQQITFTRSSLVSNTWYVGSAQATLARAADELKQPNYFVAYICTWNGTSWKCGCRDQACTTNYWQLQAFQYTGTLPGSNTDGDTGDTSGGVTGAQACAGRQGGSTTGTFTTQTSSVTEGGTPQITVTRQGNTGGAGTVTFCLTSTQAREHNKCDSQDLVIESGTVSFAAGETTKTLPVRTLNDSLAEINETVTFELLDTSGKPTGVKHTLTIEDNDRKNLVNVKNYSATGNGSTDDTSAIQNAVDDLYAKGGGVLFFPAGTYRVNNVRTQPNISYVGYKARIKRIDKTGAGDKWGQALTMTGAKVKDTRPIIFQGLTIDGNRMKACSPAPDCYNGFKLEQARLLYVGGSNQGGRAQVYVEDLKMYDGTGDGVSTWGNADLRVCHAYAKDVFRGGFVVVGGNLTAKVYDLVTDGDMHPTGIDIETEGSKLIDITMEKIRLLKGDLDIIPSVRSDGNGSKIVIKDLISKGDAAPFIIFGMRTKIRISDGVIYKGGPTEGAQTGQIWGSVDLQFDNVDFYLTEGIWSHNSTRNGLNNLIPEGNRAMNLFQVTWRSYANQKIICNNCRFFVNDKTVEAGDGPLYVAGTNAASNNPQLIINGGQYSSRFDGLFKPGACVGCVNNGAVRVDQSQMKSRYPH